MGKKLDRNHAGIPGAVGFKDIANGETAKSHASNTQEHKEQQLAIHHQVKLSKELASIMGKDSASRQEIGKKLRSIFKERHLYVSRLI